MLGADEGRQGDPVRLVTADADDVGARVPGDLVAVVVVHAQDVDGRGDHVEVAVADDALPRPALPVEVGGVLDQVGGVAAAEDGVEEEPVVQGVDAPRGVHVDGVVGVAGVGHGEVEAHPETYVVAAAPQLVGHHSVAEEEVVGRDEPGHALLPARRVVARGVAEERGAERLVEGRPRGHPVAQDVVHREGVLDEAVGGVAVGPAARVLEDLRQVPVVERQPRRDVVAGSSSTSRS